MTETRRIRTNTETAICGFCNRGLLCGERSDVFHAGGESRLTCELCQTAALRSGWRRDPQADTGSHQSTNPGRARLLERLRGRPVRNDATPDPLSRRDEQRVLAEPRGSVGRIRAALGAFNATEHLKTVGGVAHSLGDPTLTAVDLDDAGVDIVAGWDLCWYRWRVELDHGTTTVIEAGRGYDLAELGESLLAGNLILDASGQLASK